MNSTANISTGRVIFNISLFVFLGIAFFFLITEHQAHFFGVLPYLFLLACPFMHMFMHRGHNGHHHDVQKTLPKKNRKVFHGVINWKTRSTSITIISHFTIHYKTWNTIRRLPTDFGC